MALRRGVQGAEEEAKKARANFGRAEYFRMKDGETLTFRLLDGPADWIYTNQHSFVPTKGAPPDADEKAKANWPKRMGSVCRKDDAFKNDDGTFLPGYGDCYICDHMKDERKNGRPFTAPVRLWARLLIREAVEGTPAMVEQGMITEPQIGKVVGFKDAITENSEVGTDGKETGKIVRHPHIVVANLALDNFFGALQGFADVYAPEGGILNRDITVTRKGEGTETEYRFVPRSVTPTFDLADPETKAKYEEFAAQAHLSVSDLEKMIENLASEEYYARYFDPTKPFPASRSSKDSDGSASGASVEQQHKPVETPATQDALAAMRSRVLAGNGRVAETTDEPTGAVNFSAT